MSSIEIATIETRLQKLKRAVLAIGECLFQAGIYARDANAEACLVELKSALEALAVNVVKPSASDLSDTPGANPTTLSLSALRHCGDTADDARRHARALGDATNQPFSEYHAAKEAANDAEEERDHQAGLALHTLLDIAQAALVVAKLSESNDDDGFEAANDRLRDVLARVRA